MSVIKEKRADEIKRLCEQNGLSVNQVLREAEFHNILVAWDKADPKSFQNYDAIMSAIVKLSKQPQE